jgi:hypothetical protein
MKRRINFTGRKKIMQESVQINVTGLNTPNVAFNCSADLGRYNFPESAAVFLDIYQKKYVRQRFSLGTAGSPVIIRDEKIPKFSPFPALAFRITVTDTGQESKLILGRSSPIYFPSSRPGSTVSSILPLRFQKDIKQVWRIDFDSGKPVLLMNSDIEGIEVGVRKDALLRHSIFPAVLREILFYLFIIKEPDMEDETTQKWIQYMDKTLGINSDDRDILTDEEDENDGTDNDRKMDVIESIVERFSDQNFPVQSDSRSWGS